MGANKVAPAKTAKSVTTVAKMQRKAAVKLNPGVEAKLQLKLKAKFLHDEKASKLAFKKEQTAQRLKAKKAKENEKKKLAKEREAARKARKKAQEAEKKMKAKLRVQELKAKLQAKYWTEVQKAASTAAEKRKAADHKRRFGSMGKSQQMKALCNGPLSESAFHQSLNPGMLRDVAEFRQ